MHGEAIGVQCTDIYNILKCIKKPIWIGKGMDRWTYDKNKYSKMFTVESRQWVYSSFNLSESSKFALKCWWVGRVLNKRWLLKRGKAHFSNKTCIFYLTAEEGK